MPGEFWISGEDAVEWPYEMQRMRRRLRQALGRLPPRQEEVLRLRFGIGTDEEPMTLVQIGERYGVTGPRIRQIETRALLTLRESDEKFLKQTVGWRRGE